ncbi:MAG: transposase [Nitrospira sp.]|nr:transposase [Nitrospira sp.]
MARPLRIEFPGAVYHVTSRGNARQDIVADDRDRATFLTLVAHVIDRYSWRCHAYCLMDNHYHLVLETLQPNLSLGMRQLNGRYTQAYNRRHRRVGHLFQGRFTAILVEKETHLLELCRYVVLNPVRAKMVMHPRLWAWSSYRGTAGELTGPAWLSTDWILGQLGRRQREAQMRYREFVAEGRGGSHPWDQLRGQIYLGSEAFIERHQPDRVIREIPRRQTQAKRPPLPDVFQRRGREAQLIAVAYRKYGYRLHEIATHLGVHYATVSRRLKQAEQANI